MKHFLKHTGAHKSVHNSDFILLSEHFLNGESLQNPFSFWYWYTFLLVAINNWTWALLTPLR